MLRWRPPAIGRDVRVDHALVEGGAVPTHYDSMIAKLVAHGPTREEARRKLLLAMQDCALLGVASNQAFLADCLSHPAFVQSEVHTGFIAQHMTEALSRRQPNTFTIAAAALACTGWPASGSSQLSRITNTVGLGHNDHRWQVDLEAIDGGVQASVTTLGAEAGAATTLQLLPLAHRRVQDDGQLWLEFDGQVHSLVHALDADSVHLFLQGRSWRFERPDPRKARELAAGSGAVAAPLAGRVAAVNVALDQIVEAGQTLLVLEAMKMEHTLTAPFAGRITELTVQVGHQARAGAKLAQVVALDEAQAA